MSKDKKMLLIIEDILSILDKYNIKLDKINYELDILLKIIKNII